MNSRILVIEPDTDMHEQLSGSLQATRKRRHATTALYNEIAEAYNRCEVEGFVVADGLNDKRISNLEKVFSNRGLTRYADYDVYRPTMDAEGITIPKDQRKTLIKRMNETLMRVV